MVGRFSSADRYVIISVYQITDPEEQKTMYGYKCEYCEGSVQPWLVDR